MIYPLIQERIYIVKPIELLRSHNAVIVVLVVALLAQMPHAQYVFLHFGHDADTLGKVEAWFAAFALEVAVLIFVAQGNVRASWGFAVFSIAINLVYYHAQGQVWYHPQPQWLLSAGLPIAIALYSHQVAEPVHSAPATVQDDAQPEYTIVHAKNDIVQAELSIVHDEVDPKQRAAQLKSEGFTNAQIAEMMGVHRNTVGAWVRQPVHTNGYHKAQEA
jgi:hypothetical protein